MDLFYLLSSELRLKEFLRTRYKKSISSLIQASPTLLQLYLKNKTRINRKLLAIDLDMEAVQDAMTILLFLTL
jgi:hypothetical protein